MTPIRVCLNFRLTLSSLLHEHSLTVFVLIAAVGGCEWTDRNDAGNLEFDWLEVQLTEFRRRGVHVSCRHPVQPVVLC
jgi:hypothetical protein